MPQAGPPPPGAAPPAPDPAAAAGLGPASADPNADPAYDPGDIPLNLEDASESENREYERAYAALEEMLYDVDGTAKGISKMIDPNNKVESTIKANLTVLNQLDEGVDLDEIVVPQITQDIVDKVSELGEARYSMEYSERDLQATLGATWEGALAMFGIDPEDYKNFMTGYDENQIGQLKSAYQGFLGKPSEQPQAPPQATPGAPAGVPGPAPQSLPAPPIGGGGPVG